MRDLLALAIAGLAFAMPVHAQSLVGTWQAEVFGQRGVTKFTAGPGGKLHGEAYFPGQEFSGNTLNGNPISTVSVEGRHVRYALDDDDVSFDGELSADGTKLIGTSTRAGQSVALTFDRATAKTAWPIDPTPHQVKFVEVEPGVRLEVLDWGGNGPPLMFLAGHGDTAHVFDSFAQKFTDKHHVYGITRRGWGLSSRPPPDDVNYDSDRLGDDVLAVIAALKLDRPIVAGHSLGGAELSSIGTRHPERVSGLIYLDASYSYAFYGAKSDHGANFEVNLSDVRRKLLELMGVSPVDTKRIVREIQAALPALEDDFSVLLKLPDGLPPGARPSQPSGASFRERMDKELLTSLRKYTAIKGPVLALVAYPHACPGNCDTPQAKAAEADVAAQADAFEAGTPQARVVRIPGASHFLFITNEAQVVQEMNTFMDGLR